jgi:hypothetical protein
MFMAQEMAWGRIRAFVCRTKVEKNSNGFYDVLFRASDFFFSAWMNCLNASESLWTLDRADLDEPTFMSR